jgi:hypothetical protein
MPITSYGPVKSVAELLERLTKVRSRWPQRPRPKSKGEEETLWFRGQRCAGWTLCPKFYRPEYKDAFEEEIRQEFQSRAMQLIHTRLPVTDFDWNFLMQHYRAPTRLLDWTDSPLVGLFFAVAERQKDNCDAAVWVLDPWWHNKKLRMNMYGPMLPDWKEAQGWLHGLEKAFSVTTVAARDLPAAIDPPHLDRRVAAQGSRFIIFGKRVKDLLEAPAVKEKDCRLAKIIISKARIGQLLDELQDYGVTVSSLFPDLDGLGRHIAERWKKHEVSDP